MWDAEEDDGEGRADEGAEHVTLGVPVVALGAEECLRGFSRDEGGGPFEEFVDRADGHADADDAEGQPSALCDDVVTDEYFAANDGGDEALQEVAEAVVVIAGETEGFFRPITERDEGVGVVTANDEDDHVEGY